MKFSMQSPAAAGDFFMDLNRNNAEQSYTKTNYCMKRRILFVLLIISSNCLYSQVYVKVRPTITTQPGLARPATNFIWIEPGWVVSNGVYVQTNGYWTAPRPGYRYTPGKWKHHRGRGHIWIPGCWIRIR
jgi:hypothetical protein